MITADTALVLQIAIVAGAGIGIGLAIATRRWNREPERGTIDDNVVRRIKRDATFAELELEPDAVIEELARGGMGASYTTRIRAQHELEARRFDRQRRGEQR